MDNSGSDTILSGARSEGGGEPSGSLRGKIAGRKASVAVLGLGYVGLPLCIFAAEAGYRVTGFDVEEERVRAIADGKSYLEDIGADRVKQAAADGKLQVTTDKSSLTGFDIFIICVPTPLTPNQVPDLSFLLAAAGTVSSVLGSGSMVIVESTTYPGCTRDDIRPILEQHGLKAGRDFHLAFSPERVNPGSGADRIKSVPKLVGGMTGECLTAASDFYRSMFDDVVEMTSVEATEMAKLLENVYRSVNIALVNELATICTRMSISVWEVIDAAATKPFGFTPFYPGPGLGGHCIPIDPFYLSWKARELGLATEFIELAGKVNTRMPVYVVDRLAELLNGRSRSIRGSSIFLLGAAYKADVADTRESPAIRVAELLAERGADVSFHDPLIGSFMAGGVTYSSLALEAGTLAAADCVIALTPHTGIDWEMVYRQSALLLDTRNVVPHDGKKSFSI